ARANLHQNSDSESDRVKFQGQLGVNGMLTLFRLKWAPLGKRQSMTWSGQWPLLYRHWIELDRTKANWFWWQIDNLRLWCTSAELVVALSSRWLNLDLSFYLVVFQVTKNGKSS